MWPPVRKWLPLLRWLCDLDSPAIFRYQGVSDIFLLRKTAVDSMRRLPDLFTNTINCRYFLQTKIFFSIVCIGFFWLFSPCKTHLFAFHSLCLHLILYCVLFKYSVWTRSWKRPVQGPHEGKIKCNGMLCFDFEICALMSCAPLWMLVKAT